MAVKLALTDEQKKAFDEILYGGSPLQKTAVGGKEFDPAEILSGTGKVVLDLKQLIGEEYSTSALLVCSPSDTKTVLGGVAKFVSIYGKKPVPVLFANNYKTVLELLKDAGVENNFSVIDCVSQSIYPIKEEKEISFVESLRNLTQIQISIQDEIRKNKNSVFIFDSIDVLYLYHEEQIVQKFLSSVVKMLESANRAVFFISAKSDLQKKVVGCFEDKFVLKKYY